MWTWVKCFVWAHVSPYGGWSWVVAQFRAFASLLLERQPSCVPLQLARPVSLHPPQRVVLSPFPLWSLLGFLFVLPLMACAVEPSLARRSASCLLCTEARLSVSPLLPWLCAAVSRCSLDRAHTLAPRQELQACCRTGLVCVAVLVCCRLCFSCQVRDTLCSVCVPQGLLVL